ncbi:SseB family protein [Weissella muntiaci]|uniref:SseB family protein n=1 Tax=Weissella muntiaci TaxID=2508881 RepID=A0A6C2C3U3_9LACO|nr:SseB family protein [Weissella muntiaci]TYC48349.1 SseB family protein [Weissella muntiaci]
MDPENWENEAVLAALAAYQEDENAENEQELFDMIQRAIFIAPVQISNMQKEILENKMELTSDLLPNLITFETKDGNKVFPIFTDINAMKERGFDNEDVVYSWPITIFEYGLILLLSSNVEGLVLNPFSDGFVLTKDELLTMLQHLNGSIARTTERTAIQGAENSQLVLEDIKANKLPISLFINLIAIADDKRGLVQTVYIVWLTNKTTGVSNYLVVLDGTDDEKLEASYNEFALVFERYADILQTTVDIVTLQKSGLDMSSFTPQYTFYV